MTSTNDGKDVKSNQTSGHKGKTYYIELYKSLEARLSGEGSLEARTGHLCDAWRRVYSLHQHSAPSTHPHLLTWLQRHTALTVLQTEWRDPKSKDEHSRLGAAIDALIGEAGEAAAARPAPLPWEQLLLQRAHWFRGVLHNPWGHPVLERLLNPTGEPVTDEQVLEWLTEERGIVFVTRLRTLAAAKHCRDLALTLASAVMDRARAARPARPDDAAQDAAEPEDEPGSFCATLRREAGFSQDVWDLLVDIEFVLLHKRDKRARCIELAKQTPLRNGYHLVERLRTRPETSPRDKKLWKDAKEVATLIAQVVIARCMVLGACAGAGRSALYCCARSLARLLPAPRLRAVAAALAAPAATARHLHTLCSAIHAQCTDDMMPFVCELYVRAITAGMNELERLKLNKDKQSEARSAEQMLASWFTQLGSLLSASARLKAECALTAFSVHPAHNMYERVRAAPLLAPAADALEPKSEGTSEFNSWANDSRTQSNLVKTSETLQLKHAPRHANVLSTAILTEGEALGLHAELGQDLAVLLAGPRLKTLSWDMDRELLLENCAAHMERTQAGTRALTTELKYLNLDPRAFLHLPEEGDDENDAYYGIEKGYEHLVQLEEPEEIWQNAFFDPEQTESAAESEIESYQLPIKKKNRNHASSDEDSDPLSILSDAKKEKKKQANRDKSKEHRRKKSHKQDSSKERRKDKDKKPKKERKKSKSDQPATGSVTLTSLLGMKVTEMPTQVQDGEKRVRKKKERRRDETSTRVSVTDSDYDSQGKLSQVSDNNDPNVLVDGLFSMEGLNSADMRKSDDVQKVVDNISPAIRNDVSNLQNPAVVKAKKPVRISKSPSVRSTASEDSDVSRAKSPYLTPNQLINRHVVSNKVKNSITKLLQFRRSKPKTASVVPKSQAPSGHLSDNARSQLSNHSLLGMKIFNPEEVPKVYMNKKQCQELEAIKNEVNNLLNIGDQTKNSAYMPKIPYNESANELSKLKTPLNIYNAQKHQDLRYSQQYNSSPNIVPNRNACNESLKAYSDYLLSSPQKQSYNNYMTSQPPRPTSVIDSSYVSPSKQIDRQTCASVAPSKPPTTKLTNQLFHKSMQNLTNNDDVKFDQSKKHLKDIKYYSQYAISNTQQTSPSIQSNSDLKSPNATQSLSPNFNSYSMQQQQSAMAKARDDFIKFYQSVPSNDLRSTSQSRGPPQLNTQASPNLNEDVIRHGQKQMNSLMQDILTEKLGAASSDVAKRLQTPNEWRLGHASNTKPYSSHTEVSNTQHNFNANDKLQRHHGRLIQNQVKPSPLTRDTTPAKQLNVQNKQQASKIDNQNNFEDFLKELQKSINAGVTASGKQSVPLNKEVKVTPVNPTSITTPAKKSDLITHSAKQLIQQKKTENAPNTFSRLSYMHKNKQSEIKLQNDAQAISLELNKNIMDHKISKAKYMKNEVTISRVDKSNPVVNDKGNAQTFRKIDKTGGHFQKDFPVLTSMLDAKPLDTSKRTSQPSSSDNNSTFENSVNREHADLLLLLRNQQTFTIPKANTNPSTVDLGPSSHAQPIVEQIKSPDATNQTYQRPCDKDIATSSLTGTNVKKDDSMNVLSPHEKNDGKREADDKRQDWESVMSALLAHKTQPLGPNALDMVLKKERKHSHCNSRSNTSSKPKTPISTCSKNKAPDSKRREHHSSRSGSSSRKPSTEKHAEIPKLTNQTEVIKKIPDPKRTEGPNKHFTSNPLKQNDPFISGIPNSDYDLLEELMDDDLRQEIGELSSDEEYRAPAVTTKAKAPCSAPKINANTCSKQADVPKAKPRIITPKTIFCNNVPNLKRTDTTCTGTAVNACTKAGFTNVITHHPVIQDTATVPETRPTVLCSSINSQHMTTNIIANQTETNHYIANIATNNPMEPTNLIITSVPAQPMVLISQELVYDPYPTIRIHENQVNAGLCNITQNAYVTLNTAPNIAVYQTTQFAAPVINPVIIGNAMTTTTNVTNALAIESQHVDSKSVKNEEKPTIITETKPDIEGRVMEDTDTTIDIPTNLDCNMNKNNERKVLSQVQENHTSDSSGKDSRTRRLSVDRDSVKTEQDVERIKMKRQSLMNRKVSHPCHPPIPLTYTPLGKKVNIGKLLHGTPKNGAVKLNYELKSKTIVDQKDTSVNASIESPKSETNNENIENPEQAFSAKENHQVCRRILLRSSNKLEKKITPSKNVRIPLRRNKVKIKVADLAEKVASSSDLQENKDKTTKVLETPKRISRRLMNKNVKVKSTKPNTDLSIGTKEIQKVSLKNSKAKESPDLKLIDFENELSGSKILKTSPTTCNADKVQQDLETSTKAKLERVESQPVLEKTVQVDHKKPASLDAIKETLGPNKSNASTVAPTVLIEKLKTNLGEQLIIKSTAVTKTTKQPIVMTIKNQKQSILSIKAKDSSAQINNISENVAVKVAVQTNHTTTDIPAVATTFSNNNSSETGAIDNDEPRSETKPINCTGKNLPIKNNGSPDPTSEQPDKEGDNLDQIQTLPAKEASATNKGSEPSTVMTRDKANEVTPDMQSKNDRHVVLLNANSSLIESEESYVHPKQTTQNCTADIVNNPEIRNKIMESNQSPVDNNTDVNKSLVCQEPINEVLKSTNVERKAHKIDAESVNLKKAQSQIIKPNNKKKNVTEFRKEDVVIEEIPIMDNNDPTKKCVRIKLPTGKVFKATVFGKIHIDYDTLFADPAMRGILTKGLTEGKRYTLNIKQISKTQKNNPTQLLDTQIREINIVEKVKGDVETVNLISDDEDDDTRSFSTEFGKYSTKIDLETFTKHQKKFVQKCFVKLCRDNIFKSNRTKPKSRCRSTTSSLVTRNKGKLLSKQLCKSSTVPDVQVCPNDIKEHLPAANSDPSEQPFNTGDVPSPLILKRIVHSNIMNNTEVIEIDDSSNDSTKVSNNTNVEPVKKIVELKNLLLQDLGVANNQDVPLKDNVNIPDSIIAVENLKNALLEDLGVAETTEELREVKEQNNEETNNKPIQALIQKKCLVKISKCDNLVKKYESIKQAKKCFVLLQRCDALQVKTDLKLNDVTEQIEVKESSLDYSEDFIDFDVDETSDSPKLSRCPSLSILNLWDDTLSHQTPESLYGRSSPVMQIFDALVSLYNKSKDFEKVPKVMPITCCSEWTMTKVEYRFQEITEISHIIETKVEENKHTFTVYDDRNEENLVITFKAPKLVTIALKCLEDNPDVVYRLHVARAVRQVSRNSISNNLKRKTEPAADDIASKILKLGTLALKAINTYHENFASILTPVASLNIIMEQNDISPEIVETELNNESQDEIKNSHLGHVTDVTENHESDLDSGTKNLNGIIDSIVKAKQIERIDLKVSSTRVSEKTSEIITEALVNNTKIENKITIEESKEYLKTFKHDTASTQISSEEISKEETRKGESILISEDKEHSEATYENMNTTRVVESFVDSSNDENNLHDDTITVIDKETINSNLKTSLEYDNNCSKINSEFDNKNKCALYEQNTKIVHENCTDDNYHDYNKIEIASNGPASVEKIEPKIVREHVPTTENDLNPTTLMTGHVTKVDLTVTEHDSADNKVTNINNVENNSKDSLLRRCDKTDHTTESDHMNIVKHKKIGINAYDAKISGHDNFQSLYLSPDVFKDKVTRSVIINDSKLSVDLHHAVELENSMPSKDDTESEPTHFKEVNSTFYNENYQSRYDLTKEANINENRSNDNAVLSIESTVSENYGHDVKNPNSDQTSDTNQLYEIPDDDIPREAYEVEILDTSFEEDTKIVQISNEVTNTEPITDIELEAEKRDPQIISPLIVDNKEIMFNYHDYTKPPKTKEVPLPNTEKHFKTCSTDLDFQILNDNVKMVVTNMVDHSIENNRDQYKNSSPRLRTKEDLNVDIVATSKINAKPDLQYEFIQEDDWLTVITTENDKDTSTASDTESSSLNLEESKEDPEIVTSLSTESSGVTLKGIEYEDPVIGKCYVFTLNESGSSTSNISSDSLEVFQESEENLDPKEFNDSHSFENLHNIELCVIAPKVTYSRGSLKRKRDMRDVYVLESKYRKIKYNDRDKKVTEKKYRKGKNIDCPKQAIKTIIDSSYVKEYNRLLEYCSSVKFSYSRPFHKEIVDVSEMTSNWPISDTYADIPDDSGGESLFVDVLHKPSYQPDPATQTLAEEITYQYEKTDSLQENQSDEAADTNFNMGFGEGSGRVIQNLKKGGVSNISAATLSDVKQSQPFLLSEDYDDYEIPKANIDDQVKKIRQYVNFIELRDKVRSFFKKTTVELKSDWMQHNIKECGYQSRYNDNIFRDFPFDLCSLDYVKPAPSEIIVQVVQVGQLPVSAAAQNPVTCDPRVTQVSDASPSQCSVDNSPNDDSQSEIKTEYTELTTADLTLPLVQEYAQHNQAMNQDCHDVNDLEITEQTISLEMEIKAEERPEIKQEIPEIKEERSNSVDNVDLHTYTSATPEHAEYLFENNSAKSDGNNLNYDVTEKNNSEISQQRQQNGTSEKTDQIAHAMNAAGITTTPESITNSRAHALVNILSQKIRQGSVNTTQTTTNTYSKTTSINAMALQQALAQILPPPLNQTGSSENNQTASTPVGPQVLHIVQGKNASGNQITLVDNSQQSVISSPNATQVLHIVQNKGATAGQTSNGTLTSQSNSFSGLSLVDTGLQQGGNQLLHIVNTGNQKNASPGQLLKRVNLLTNLTNVQGNNEQKMVQFVCKSADGKAIQLNAPHQRSMVLRLQPIETSNVQTPPAKPAESQDLSPSPTNSASSKESASQQEIKSRSIYEENYAKFIQNSSSKTPSLEKATSLPKFNQAFGKPVFQEGNQKQSEAASSNSHLQSVNTNNDNTECPATDNAINLEHIGQISSPPLLLRKQPAVTSQSQSNLVQQIKQTISPMNIQTMHGGVIYTRQIPVNIGGGQTINLITVPSTELISDDAPKPQTATQSEIEPSIIKIVPQSQTTANSEGSQEENNSHMSTSNENAQNSQPQPVLTQMRIKLPMLSKAPQMVPGARVVRPSFFQIQRNVIGGANQPVYQQLVLTAAPPLGQQTIRLPQAQASRPIKVPSESQSSSSESQMSSSTLEQLREFDMVLEQVKERSTVQPISNSNNTFKLHTNSSDATDGTGSSNCSNESTQQVLYSIGNNQSLNVAYVNRKATVTTPTTSTYVRSPDSTGIADSPTSSTHVQIPHTVTTDSSPTEMTSQPKPAKVGSKSKSRPKSSSNPPNTLKLNSVPPKTSSQKPLEDEQTTQRILYILAEYKEQVENSPDKDKPAPRRRSNPPSNPGSSKRKKSSSSRRSGTRDMSPVHGEDTCRTMGSEDSSCGTSQGDCTESCLDSHSPQDSPRKVARKITFDQELPTQPRPQPQRNVIVADGQTITVARGTTGKPATAVLMPANYILPVSMVKGGQQIAIVTNRGPKLLTVGGEGGAANALLLQRLIGPGGLKPVLARPGVRHVRLPTAALHNLQAFNLATGTATSVQPPDSTASPTPGPTPPELVDTRATSSPWTDRDEVKPERSSSPEGSEPWNLPSSADAHEYSYEETVRTDNMDRTVLDPIPDRYSPDMEAQRIFDKMFDVDSKKSYAVDSHDDSPRCAYDIDASDCDDKAYQVVQKKDGSQRQHRLSHVSAAALRHKYAILEHELRLQKSLSEECEDLGVDSPSASELFPEAELLFAASPAHDHNQEHHHSHTPQPLQSTIPQPDMDDQIATDHLIPREIDVSLGLGDVGIVAVSEDGMQATIALDQEEFARSHPNTTFHSEPTEGEVQPFTITGLKGRHITSTIFHSNSAPATVLMAAPQPTVISQAPEHAAKYEGDNMSSLPGSHRSDVHLSSVLVKDDGLTRFDSILTDSRELHLTNTASAIVHSSATATQVIRRVCYEDDKRERDTRFLIDEPDNLIAGDDAKMIAEDSSRDATLESMADVDDDRSSPERHAELFWESNSASERSESRRPLDFSSDSDKCCKSPSFDETNSTDSSGVGARMRLDSVIKEARGRERSGSADGSSADDAQPPLRTYPPKRPFHGAEAEAERSVSGKTRAGERSPLGAELRRRASGRGVVKRGCPCCNGEPAPPRAKKPRQRKPTLDFDAAH